jgi:LPXTG-site transpeptidase (sortase) family protein
MPLLAAACAGALLAVSGCSAGTVPPLSADTPAPASTASARAVIASGVPADLRLPTLEIEATVEPVGTTNRVLEIPPKPTVVGWWKDGAKPGGNDGTVVLTAHLDSRTYGVGPFVKAKDLKRGDPMTLRDAKGRTYRYTVDRVDTFEKQALPYERLFRQSGPERVVFVTCGGSYDADNGGWDSNVVVTFSKE